MAVFLPTAMICFVACHGAPADHFSTFTDVLVKKGYKVQIFATGAALKKFEDRKIAGVTPFALRELSEKEIAIRLAKRCAEAAVVITDVGHGFDIALQDALATHASPSLRLAYYDNPESYVPGGYSTAAAKVMQIAQGVIFANANLAQLPVYETPTQEIGLSPEKKFGLGYYPISQAEKIAKKRDTERMNIRSQFFSTHSIEDRQQKILVYSGGNNDEYFSKAFPAFLQFLTEAISQADLSNYLVVLQQHPGAKKENIDANLLLRWFDQHGKAKNAPRILISKVNSDDAQVIADGMLYYQTSMSPQFILAGIPTIQVGHRVYEDIPAKNNLCAVATDVQEFIHAITHLQRDVSAETNYEAIRRGLGTCDNWEERLEHGIRIFR